MDKWLLLYDIQSRKTPQMRGFVFSNYQSLNNWNLLLELGEILKQKPLETSCFESENQIFSELSKPQSILNKGSFQMMIILGYWKSSLQFDNASIYVLFGVAFIMFFGIFLFIFIPQMTVKLYFLYTKWNFKTNKQIILKLYRLSTIMFDKVSQWSISKYYMIKKLIISYPCLL